MVLPHHLETAPRHRCGPPLRSYLRAMETYAFAPEPDAFGRALRWISAERTVNPGRPLREIVEEAGPRFNLSPLQEEWLWQSLVEVPRADAGH